MNDVRPLAVVVKGWPRLSETFIAQELVALEEAGHNFSLWSLRQPYDAKTHPLHDRLNAPVRYLPEYLHTEPMRVLKAVWACRKLPGFAPAFAAFRKDLARDWTRNRIRRFGQACVLASETPEGTQAYYAHFMHTPSSVARYAAILGGRPWAFSAHAKDIWTSPDWEKKDKLTDATHGARFGATCTRFGAVHLRGLSDDPEKIDLVYHGLDMARFPPPPDRAPKSDAAPYTMLSVGRLVEKKGFDQLIKALALLPETLDWRWLHIGGGGDKSALVELAESKGVAHRITWRGACDQPEVIEAMRQADLFVLPSRVARNGDRDGLPNVLMEAASQKLPILSTKISAIPEFVVDGVQGRLVSDAPEDLAQAIQEFANAPDQGAAMADAAFDRLVSEFRMEPGIDRLSRRLTDLCAVD